MIANEAMACLSRVFEANGAKATGMGCPRRRLERVESGA